MRLQHAHICDEVAQALDLGQKADVRGKPDAGAAAPPLMQVVYRHAHLHVEHDQALQL